jgi:hypothetical protein
MTLLPVLALVVQAEAAMPVPPADTLALLRRAARRAEAAFERLARQRAPLTFSSWGGRCDEIVGRFCLTYDSRALPEPPPEPAEVVHARREAIEALRRAFAYAPDELDVAGPLVRYLVEDERAAEAVSAARAFHALSADTTWGALLLGFALHAANDASAATHWLELGLARLPPRERDRIEDMRWLLADDEVGMYRRLEDEERTRYHDAFWMLADPLYLSPGNERRNEHLARHVWSRILSRTPVVTDMVRWGRDLEQLTVRYGTPRSRMRALGRNPGESSMVERFDPDQLAYTPENLRRRGVPPTPLPGETWPLERPRARSGYAPSAFRRVVPLEHQVSRFPAGRNVLVRVDAAFAFDSVAAGAERVRGGLFLLDSLYRQTHADTAWLDVAGDTATLVFQTLAAPGHYVYSIEALEPASALAARSRYALELEAEPGLAISDIVVALPFAGDSLPRHRNDARLRPRGSLVVSLTDTLGLFAEAYGLARAADGRSRYRVEITRQRADRGSLPAELVAWLGRRIGIGGRDPQPRVAWTAEGVPGGPNPIAIDVALGDASAGLYVLELAITDLVSGERRATRRPLRVR